MKNKFIRGFIFLTIIFLTSACSDFLDEKSDTLLTLPEKLEDNQAMLDDYLLLGIGPSSAEISADDIYITDTDFNSLPYEHEKRLYSWQPDHVANTTDNDWEKCYRKINIYNTVLFNLEYYHIPDSENVKGQALVFRAATYLDAAQIWCLGYNPATAENDLGLPLRLDPDMNVPSVRSSIKDTYAQIISDLSMAVNLLPNQQLAPSRPSKIAALGLLARVNLIMGRYEEAAHIASEVLKIKNNLIDFNTLDSSSSYPIPQLHPEIILPTTIWYSPLLYLKAKIEPSLYNLYDENDLRKKVYFRITDAGEIFFKGNYSGGSGRSTCLAVDEMYLIAAEGYAKTGNTLQALKYLNDLLLKRWEEGTFIPFTANNAEEAVQIIRRERRKEMIFRNQRWSDLKRYNREGAQIKLKRVINNQLVSLTPNDLRYAIALPENIIKMTGIPQNPR